MSSEALKQLDDLDLSELTIDDVKKYNNPTFRDALVDVLRRKVNASVSHQNHSSHGDTTSDAGRLDEPLKEAATTER